MKDENVAAGGAVGLEGGWGGGEGVGRQEGGQELLVLAVLEVLRAPDVPAVEFELVASVNYPGTLLVVYLYKNLSSLILKMQKKTFFLIFFANNVPTGTSSSV